MIYAAAFIVSTFIVVGFFLFGAMTAVAWCIHLCRFVCIAIGRVVQRPILLAPFALVLIFVAIQILLR